MDGHAEADLLARAAGLQRAGKWQASAALYSRAFAQAVRARDLDGMIEALRGGAQVRCALQQYEEAAELAELRREIGERHGLADEVARAINMTAVIRHHQGDLTGARGFYEEALERARAVRDDELIGLVCHNLGAITNVQGDLHAARAFYLESIGSAVRSGNETSAVMAYNNLGMVCADLREWMEAELYFSRGIEIAGHLGDAPLLAKLYANRAEPLIHVGEFARARETLDAAEAVATRTGSWRDRSDVERFRCMMARLEGDLDAANGFAARALLFAAKASGTLERAEALEELARVRWAEHDAWAALGLLREARQSYHALGAARDQARTAKLLEEWTTADLLSGWVAGGEAAEAGA